jgi:hypothetical protein
MAAKRFALLGKRSQVCVGARHIAPSTPDCRRDLSHAILKRISYGPVSASGPTPDCAYLNVCTAEPGAPLARYPRSPLSITDEIVDTTMKTNGNRMAPCGVRKAKSITPKQSQQSDAFSGRK